MNIYLLFAITICIAAAGGLIGLKLKIPVGGMLFAMISVIAFNLIFQIAYFPRDLRIILQIFSGALVGSRISRSDAIGIKKLALPISVMISSMLVLNIIFGISVYTVSKLDVATSLFSTAPGGMTDMAIISTDLGANPVYVALLQLSRLMFIFVFMIPMYKILITKFSKKKEPQKVNPSADVLPDSPPAVASDTKRIVINTILTIVCSFSLGLPLLWLGVPAGAMIGAMLGSAIFNVTTEKAYFPIRLRPVFQVFAGAFIGVQMDRESFFALGGILLPVLLMCVFVIIFTLITAFLVCKLAKLDFATALLASTPGGLMEISLLADDLEADAPKVAVLQTARLMIVIILFPTMLTFVVNLL